MSRYDFGCGRRERRGWIGVDVDPAVEPEIVADVSLPVAAIPAGSADGVRCLHLLEHLVHPRQFGVLGEIARVLRPGGGFELHVPHPGHDSAMVPGHVQVLPPHYWRQMRDDAWLGGELVIEAVEEPLTREGAEFAERLGVPLDRAGRFLRNVCEIVTVRGRRA